MTIRINKNFVCGMLLLALLAAFTTPTLADENPELEGVRTEHDLQEDHYEDARSDATVAQDAFAKNRTDANRDALNDAVKEQLRRLINLMILRLRMIESISDHLPKDRGPYEYDVNLSEINEHIARLEAFKNKPVNTRESLSEVKRDIAHFRGVSMRLLLGRVWSDRILGGINPLHALGLRVSQKIEDVGSPNDLVEAYGEFQEKLVAVMSKQEEAVSKFKDIGSVDDAQAARGIYQEARLLAKEAMDLLGEARRILLVIVEDLKGLRPTPEPTRDKVPTPRTGPDIPPPGFDE